MFLLRLLLMRENQLQIRVLIPNQIVQKINKKGTNQNYKRNTKLLIFLEF